MSIVGGGWEEFGTGTVHVLALSTDQLKEIQPQATLLG